MKRKIIKIDEDKCTGCGMCIPDCPEGALQIIDGKARLVRESLCDGLGACVGTCPEGALVVEERQADAFDEEQAKENMQEAQQQPAAGCPSGGCPGGGQDTAALTSVLANWPIQLKLINPSAPYFQDAHLVIAADCVPFSYADFHRRFLTGKILIVFCPKLDDAVQEYLEKLTTLFKQNTIQSITVVHMEVPCCSGTTRLVEQAVKNSGKTITIKDHTISLKGEVV